MAGIPGEYLTLANTGGSSNFSQYTAGGAVPGTDAITHYTKVRLNPNTLLVDVNDKTFTTSTGSIYHGGFGYFTDTDYATAMDCLYGGSSTGQGNIDLRGTRFAVVDTFVPDGWIPAGSATFSSDDQVVDLQGGGYCGWISPAPRPAHDPIIDDVAYVLALRYVPDFSPTVDAGRPYNGNEGSAIAMSGTAASDPDLDTLAYAWTVNSASCSFNNVSALNPDLTCSDNGSYTAMLSVEDGVNPAVTSDAIVTVSNVAPTLGAISVDPVLALTPVNTAINASADFTDPGTLDTHSASWDWGDGISAGMVTEVSGSGTVGDSHSYSVPGVYTITLSVTDNDSDVSNESVYQYVVVYDPSGGFVTGGGWFNSPAGAYKADETLTGKATFGFVAKYKKGANVPDGNTEFQFKAGDLNFHSSSYEWLVVAGNKAQFKGEGTINGEGSYKFMITADDDNPDTFRIKIWYEDNGMEVVVYDNGSQQPLGGGSIKVHQ